MDLNYSPLLDESDRPAGVLAIVIETTERVRAQRALQDSEAHTRQVLDSATDYGIFAMHLERRVTRLERGRPRHPGLDGRGDPRPNGGPDIHSRGPRRPRPRGRGHHRAEGRDGS